MKPVSSSIALTTAALLAIGAGLALLGDLPAGEPPLAAIFPEAAIDSPLPAAEAARTMIVPEGFSVSVFAAEPDVAQPIAFCIDDRGRLWVAENYAYPVHRNQPGKDRILILEDTDGDGRHDRRKVFYEGLNYVTGIEVGFGGAWVMSPPYFFFIPDRDGDDRPDGEPQTLLDGFGNHANAHNLASALAWGPDGWLYGTHGRTNWSLIGKPGTPEAERRRFDGGVYRYHPVRHEWEPFCDGMTNPWGIDWNELGHAFVCNCVDPHLFEVIQGAHYEPWRNRESSRYAYERIATIADHRHFISEHNVRDGLGAPEEDLAGGGHAHCGMMIYLGDNWPAEHRGQAFMNNIHGKRINCDLLQRRGSGYVASHGKDLMRNRDPWFMGVTLAYGPDGGVYVTDWSDTGECHSVRNTQRQTGRIYKITYGSPKHVAVDVGTLNDDQLVELHLHRNEWFVRHARRRLQERTAAGVDLTQQIARLKAMFEQTPDAPQKLRALWTLHALGALDEEFYVARFTHSEEAMRAWCVQLLCESQPISSAAAGRLAELAATDSSPLVRRYLASAAQRLNATHAWPLVEALAARGEDAADQNIPYLVWYAAEPLIAEDKSRFLQLGKTSQLPLVQRSVARRAMAEADFADSLETLIGFVGEGGHPREILTGLVTGLQGKRSPKLPRSWPNAFAYVSEKGNSAEKLLVAELGARLGDADAARILKQVANDRSAERADRIAAIETLAAAAEQGIVAFLIDLLRDPAVAGAALRGLAAQEDPAISAAILAHYPALPFDAKADAIQTLVSRKMWAADLLAALERGEIEKAAISAYAARQIIAIGDPSMTEKLQRLWGDVRTSSQEKAEQITNLKRRLTPQVIDRGNRIAGKAIFEKECAACHKLFGRGAEIGPELSGAQRTNLDYLLENLIDPSALISREYQMTVIEMEDGRVLSGLVVEEADDVVTMQTVNERISLPKSEIAERTASSLSMMPEGIAQKLTFEELRDLIAFLSSPGPVSSSPPAK